MKNTNETKVDISKNLLIVLSFFVALFSTEIVKSEENDGSYVEEEYVNYKTSEEPLDRLAPYRERRMESGALFSISYSQFRPLDYDPSFSVATFEDVYGGDTTHMPELSLLYKINFAIGSVALGLGIGYQKLESDLAFGDSYLSVVPIRFEAMVALDTIFDNPYLVPYGIGGAYTIYYREEQAASAFTGTTEAAPYFGGGLALRIDGFMPNESFNAYKENFQENSFIYGEVRSWLSSNTENDPIFTANLQIGLGMRFEF